MNEQAGRYKVPASELTVHLIDDRRTVVSPWSRGNSKVGPGIFTYSKLPVTTCPGASEECLSICYAKRAAEQNAWVGQLWKLNTLRGYELPPLPDGARVVRFHISGDFDGVPYIESWIALASSHPEVTFFGYTRSWRVPGLVGALEQFKSLPNVFLWASMDISVPELPPPGWRRAWIDGDGRIQRESHRYKAAGSLAIICPEATGKRPNCEACKFCFKHHDIDLIFPRH